MWPYIGVAVAALAVVGLLVARRLQQRRKAHEAALAVHHSRLWRVIACLECATEILPGNDRMVCGGCPEELNYCMPCYGRTRGAPSYTPAEHEPTHELFREPTDWEVDPAPIQRARSTAAAVLASLRLYADRRCLGRRARSSTGELERRFEWWSYAEVEARAWALLRTIVRRHASGSNNNNSSNNGDGADLSQADLEAAAVALIGERLVTCCISVVEFYVAQYAAVLGGLVAVPLHATTSVDAMAHVLGLTHPVAVLTSRHLRPALESALAIAATKSDADAGTGAQRPWSSRVVLVSVADHGDTYELRRAADLQRRQQLELECEPASALAAALAASWMPFDEAVAEAASVASTTCRGGRTVLDPSGLALRASMAELERRDEYDSIVMLLPTSGTSSSPKLTIFTDHMLRTQCQPPRHAVHTVMLAHELLRQSVDLLAKGGCVAVFSGSLAHLHDDLQLVRPTVFGATPTFWYGLQQRYQSELERLKADHHHAAAGAAGAAAGAAATSTHELELMLDKRWHRDRPLGNRCKFAIVGGAGTSAAFREWISRVLQCVVIDGYGATEVGGLASNANVLAGRNVQLIDCPELGYLTSDRPHARGEIVAHTDRMTPGYFGDAAATAERFVTIAGVRFFRTGDIGEMVGTQIHVIDRRGDIFKLAQGVFVAPSPLEQLYSSCEYCSNVFIYGEAAMHHVMAAVYVDPATLVRAASSSSSSLSSSSDESMSSVERAESLDDATLEQRILESFRVLARDAHLHPWEIPSRVIIDREAPWSNSNGLLSTIGKLCRPALIKRFAPQFRAMAQAQATQALEATAAAAAALNNQQSVPVIEGLSSGLVQLLLETLPSLPMHATLGTPSFTAATSIADLGADSLSLARLVAQIRERHGVSIALPTLAKLPSLLHLQLLVFSGGLFSLGSLTDKPSTSGARASDVDSDARRWYERVDEHWQHQDDTEDATTTDSSLAHGVATARWLSSQELQQRHVVLLTGATGFYGSFVLHQLLSSSALSHTRIHCIVRATSAQHGLQRIAASLESYCLPTDGLERVVAEPGDIERPWMGLDRARVEQLVGELLFVVHNGAVVNSFLSYDALRGPNVLGTKWAVMLAARAGVPLHHVSTIGMLAGSGTLDEERHIAPVALRILSGYAQSKWVAEQLVHRAADAGMSVTISRPGTIAGHSLTGACNLSDTVVRLIAGLAHEHVVCCDDGTPLSKLYALVPVDWAAEALVRIVEHQLARVPAAVEPNVFHLVSRSPVPLAHLVAAIRALGIELVDLSADDFKQRMRDIADDESHPLFVFTSILGGAGYASGSAASCPTDTNTATLLHQSCPHVSGDMLQAMVRYCIDKGLIV